MAAKRKSDLHETGDAKMKAAALKYAAKESRVKSLDASETVTPVPSPARQLQDQLQAHISRLQNRCQSFWCHCSWRLRLWALGLAQMVPWHSSSAGTPYGVNIAMVSRDLRRQK